MASQGIHMRGSSFAEDECEAKPVPFEAPKMAWDELIAAQLTYPSLTLDDQGTWLGMDHVHHGEGLLHGYFTFRLVTNRFGPSLDEHIERGKTHMLMSMRDVKRAGEIGERMLHLFLVDIRKASLNRHLAELKRNRYKEEYLLFDTLTPGVDKFYERLRLR